MNQSQWLREFQTGLQRSGLPLSYTKRSVSEIRDHLIESRRDSDSDSSICATPPEQLASQFQIAFRQSRWFRRIPVLFWILLPLPISMIVCLGFYISFLVVLQLLTCSDEPFSGLSIGAGPLLWLLYTGKVVTPIIASFVLLNLFERVAISRTARACSVVMLALAFVVTLTNVTLPDSASGASFMIMFEAEEGITPGVIFGQIVQVVAVLAVALAEAIRASRLRQTLELC